MSNITVPVLPPMPPAPGAASTSVRNGVAVSGRDWAYLAKAIAYARGRGSVLVPAFDPMRVIAAGATATFNLKGYQRYPCIQRLWIVRAHRSTVVGGESQVVTIAAPSGGTAQTYAVSTTGNYGVPMWLLEDNVTQAEGEVDLSIDITNGSASSSIVADQILCVEPPRLMLTGGSPEYGADPESNRGGEAIFYGTGGESVGGIVDAYASALLVQPQRGSLFSWGAPDASALTTASTSDVDVFQPTPATTGNPKIRCGMGSKGAYTATTKTVQLRARMKVSGAGVGGRILVTTRLGATATLTCTIGATAFAWYTATIDIDCDDMTTLDGRRSGASEELSAVWKNTNTAGSIFCSAFEVLNG